MATPIILVGAGGVPITITPNGTPFTPVSTYAFPATIVAAGGIPVRLVNVDGSAYSVGPDVTAPAIATPSAISWPENSAFTYTLSANEIVTWTKTGGADAALFTLAGNTLSMAAKDYETPSDADANNAYVVQVTATDGAGNASSLTITVTITDVAEGGGGGTAPAAPSLAWSGVTTDTTPDLVITFTSPQASDVATVQLDTSNAFPNASSTTDTLDAGQVSASSVSLSLSTLADGVYYARAKVTRGGVDSAWSNVVTITISTAVASNALLRTDGSYILRTDGSKILRAA